MEKYELVKVAGYELTPSKSEIEKMVDDMMLKIDIVIGEVDLEDNPDIENVVLPEGFSHYTVARLAAQAAMMETFASSFKKKIAKRLPVLMRFFEGSSEMSKNGNSLFYNGVTFTKKAGAREYDYSASEKWAKKAAKVEDLEMKLKLAKIELKAVEEKMRENGEAALIGSAADSVSMALGK